jgi:hypothetical protein
MNTLLLLTVLVAAGPPVEAQPLSGDAVEGTLVELGPQAVTLETPKGRVALETGKLAGLAFKPAPGAPPPAAPKPNVWLELVDGGTVQAAAYASQSGKATVRALGEPATTLEIATQDIRWVRFQAENEAMAKQWAKIRDAETASDVLVTRKDDVLDYHKGVLKNVTEEAIEFELEGETLPVKRAKVFAVVYRHPAGRELPDALCAVHEASGSVWPARAVSLAGDKVEWTTPAGVKVALPVASVVRLDFSRGKIVYLGDLKPESVQWTPYFGLGKELPVRAEFYAPRVDRSMSGGALELDAKTWKKGVAIHSRTSIVYRLPGRFSRFTALAGIDDRVRPRGHVRLLIQGDDKTLFDGPIAGNEPGKPLDLDVTGVRRLSILVDFGNDLDIADHLDLCDARLVK